MHWLNEPASWQRTDDVLRVTVDPGTDFWRATGYGYIHDNGHVYGDRLPGDLDVSVRMRGTFAHQYDQAGIMLRADEQTWLKTGVEFFEGRLRLSTVLTLGWSSWIVADLPADLEEITLRASRRGDAVEVRYAAGDGAAELAALVFMPPDCEVMAGVMCAAPEGSGFIVTFNDLRIAGREWGAPQPGQPAAEWTGDGGTGTSPGWDEPHSNGAVDWFRVPAGETAQAWPDGPDGLDGGRMPAEWADEEPAGIPAEWGGEKPGGQPGWGGEEPGGKPPWDDSEESGGQPGWGDEKPGGKPPWDDSEEPSGEPPWDSEEPVWPQPQASVPAAGAAGEGADDKLLLDWAQPLASDAATDWDLLSGSLSAKRGGKQAAGQDEEPAGGNKTAGGKKKKASEPAVSPADGKTDPALPAAISPASPAGPAGLRAAVARQPGLAVCGAAYDGIGIPACIATARTAASRVLAYLRESHPRRQAEWSHGRD